VDYQTPILTDRLSIVGGVTLERSNRGNGAFGNYVSLGIAPRWTPGPQIEVIPFASMAWSWEQEAQPLAFVDQPRLPDRIDRSTDFGQKWTDNRAFSSNLGLLTKVGMGDYELRAGLFHSRFLSQEGYNDLFLNVDENNIGDHVIIADRDQEFQSLSGEIRLSRSFTIHGNPHTIFLIGRGRDQRRRYGGSAVLEFGRAEIGVPVRLAKPAIAYGEQVRDAVRQLTGAIAYNGRPFDWLEVSTGVQRAFYRKTTRMPGTTQPLRGNDDPWLYNLNLAAQVSTRLALYASYTRGLEEGGVAPENAINKGTAAPALVTRQVDAGFRYALTDEFRLVGGVFDVRKPYYNLDSGRVYRALGAVRQRGVEVSLSGSPVQRLNLVAGAVLTQPRVRGEEVSAGLLGKVPVGQTGRLIIASADYQLAALKGLSINATVTSVGRRIASRDNRLAIPSRTVLDLGTRYRFTIGTAPATLSVRLSNVFNTFGWRTNGSGVLLANDRRRLAVSLAADF